MGLKSTFVVCRDSCRSVGLLMQVSLPCALFAHGPSELCLKGGTNAEMAPQIDYTMKVRVDVYLRNGQDQTVRPFNSVHFMAMMF